MEKLKIGNLLPEHIDESVTTKGKTKYSKFVVHHFNKHES